MTIIVNCVFRSKFSYLKIPDVQHSTRYPAFTRNDFRNWNFFEMTLVGIFLFPIRVLLILILIIWTAIWFKILALFCCIRNYDTEMPCFFRTFTNLILSWNVWFIMKLMGFYWPKVVRIKYRNQNPHLEAFPNTKSIINVSNHTSFVDIFYFISRQSTGFIAKSGTKNFPLIGTMAEAVQCLFVDRLNKNSKAQIFEKLQFRIEETEKGKHYNPITIFPEGTTTNNKGIVDFKRGAFSGLHPVWIYGLKYTSRFHPMLNMVEELGCFMGICLQFCNSMTVYQFTEPIGPKSGVSANEFCEQVKLLMCDEFKFEDYHNTFEEKIEFEQMHLGYDINSYK